MKKLLMVVNPRAGKNKPRGPLFDAAAAFCEAGYLLDIRETAGPGDARDMIRRDGAAFDAVAAAGGDGTLSEAVSGLMALDNPPPLCYLPQGSTNDFAASLRISPNPAEAARTAVHGVPRRLDVGRWNDRYFVYVASFGAFTRTSYSAAQSAKNALGHFAYLLEGVRDLDSLRPYRVRLEADGERLDGEYLFGAVSNSTSIGGVLKLDGAGVAHDDGLLELLLVPSPRNPAELQTLMMALVNQEYGGGGLVFRHAASVRLETEDDFPWSLDGEYAPGAPVVELAAVPRALTLLL